MIVSMNTISGFTIVFGGASNEKLYTQSVPSYGRGWECFSAVEFQLCKQFKSWYADCRVWLSYVHVKVLGELSGI